MSVLKLFRPPLFAVALMFAVPLLHALEYGVDGSLASSTLVDDWGVATHLQIIGDNHLGLDLGYQYLNSMTYDGFGSAVSHAFSQYEVGLLWQLGEDGLRLQTQAGMVLSGNALQAGTDDLITMFQPGYQVGLGLSVPIFTRFRAFADAGYQGWLAGEIPDQTRWRYGLRLNFGGVDKKALAAEEAAQAQQEAERQQALIDNPPVTIDTAVPVYVPSTMSQSLPPILSLAELCKCFPAGPFTLQLGQFGNMQQAVRSLEFRGLRQFFNSRAYQKAPLPVFLSQSSDDMPVGIYLGELETLAELKYWHHELRKSGLSARFRKILGSNGQRVENPIVAMDDKVVLDNPIYTAEEIRRMNTLAEDYVAPVPEQKLLVEKAAYDNQLASKRTVLNQAPVPQVYLADTAVQIGPIDMSELQALLSVTAMREALARTTKFRVPLDMALVWDEGKQEAWLNFARFEDEQHLDEWRAWLDSEGMTSRRLAKPFNPLGDVYEFQLGQAQQEFSIEITRHDVFDKMLHSMTSPEILWFQAYQRINDRPIHTSLNWSMADSRYHLIVTNVQTSDEQQVIWSSLTAVGLLPSLAEE